MSSNFVYTSPIHGMTKVKLFSKKEMMKHWTSTLRGMLRMPAIDTECYTVKNISMASALVMTSLWLRKVHMAVLLDTAFDPANNILYFDITGVASANSRVVDKRYIVRDILATTEYLVNKCLMTGPELLEMSLDEKGVPLFQEEGF